MKKYRLYLLGGYFILLLVIPGFFVCRHYNTLYNGESYKFEVAPYDPYDPFRGRYVAIRTAVPLYHGDGEYAVLQKDDNGYANITEWTAEKPAEGDYAKNLQLTRYYMNEEMAPRAEQLQNTLDWNDESMYLLVNVKNGHYVIQGLYINDIPIERYIEGEQAADIY